jgi:hypothetical protein
VVPPIFHAYSGRWHCSHYTLSFEFYLRLLINYTFDIFKNFVFKQPYIPGTIRAIVVTQYCDGTIKFQIIWHIVTPHFSSENLPRNLLKFEFKYFAAKLFHVTVYFRNVCNWFRKNGKRIVVTTRCPLKLIYDFWLITPLISSKAFFSTNHTFLELVGNF